MSKDEAFNMRLIAHDDLNGFGNGGEGMSLQVAGDGRRVLWIGMNPRRPTSPASRTATAGW